MVMISEKHRTNVNIVLADNDPYMRQGLRNALASKGYRTVRTVGRVSMVRDLLIATPPDLLIVDVETPSGDAIELVSEIRSGKAGMNPFLPVILIAWDTTPAAVRRAADSGADFILMKPFSPAQLFKRIERLFSSRKSFVATSHYVGPVRQDTESSSTFRTYEVPNTLKDKLEGKTIDQTDLANQISQVLGKIGAGQLEQSAQQLACTVQQACMTLENGNSPEQMAWTLSEVVQTAKDLRASNTGDIAKLCTSLIRVSATMHRDPSGITDKEMELLSSLARLILLAANPDMQEPTVIDEISRAVSRFTPNRCDRPCNPPKPRRTNPPEPWSGTPDRQLRFAARSSAVRPRTALSE